MSAYQYIIVVHGMGESRYGQTILPVVSRCAEVVHGVLDPEGKVPRRKISPYEKEGRDIVTLGAFVGASPLDEFERPWVEFQGIPTEAGVIEPFTGITTHNPEGKLIRFVEIWWKDLVDKSDMVLEPASPWADGLIGRIERLNVSAPNWMPQLLFKLQDVLGPVQTVMKARISNVEDIAFNKYLGDVQIYAEYDPMRGVAVRRFHERMEEVYKAHLDSLPRKEGTDEPETLIEPQFTVIAHSLGTIMSLDALMYAHFADRENRKSPIYNFPFQGYTHPLKKNKALLEAAITGDKSNPPGKEEVREKLEEVPDTTWVRYVKMFVTLGSPIDKFLLFWPYRYQYLNTTEWIDKGLRGNLIRHINYCDEQDPVGQSLDTLRTTEAYNAVFTAGIEDEGASVQDKAAESMGQRVKNRITEYIKVDKKANREFDVVYQRSLWPGLAHTSYWKDKDLFKNILDHILNPNAAGTPQNPNVVKDKRGKYVWIALLTYFVIPLFIITIDTVTYDMLLEPVSWKGYFALSLLFVGTVWLSREALNLLVWWRQLLRNKRNKEVVSSTITSIFVMWIVRLGLPLLAIGFSQVTISTSDAYVNWVKHPPATLQNAPSSLIPTPLVQPTRDGNASQHLFWSKLPEPVRVVLSPFLLISGNTSNPKAFWVALLSLFVLLVWYRRNFSNYKESARYEQYLSLPVDIIVVLVGYGILLILWQEQTGMSLIAGNLLIWQHPVGLISIGALTFWHVNKYRRDRKALKNANNNPTKNKSTALRIPDYLVSFIVLFVGWIVIERLSSGSSSFLLTVFGDDQDSLNRITYFCFIGAIIWVYMALRFYVAKLQLGADGIDSFKKYCEHI